MKSGAPKVDGTFPDFFESGDSNKVLSEHYQTEKSKK